MQAEYARLVSRCYGLIFEGNLMDFAGDISKKFEADPVLSQKTCFLCYSVWYLKSKFRDILTDQGHDNIRRTESVRRLEVRLNLIFHNVEYQRCLVDQTLKYLCLARDNKDLPTCHSCRRVSIPKLICAYIFSPMLDKISRLTTTTENCHRIFRSYFPTVSANVLLHRYLNQAARLADDLNRASDQKSGLATPENELNHSPMTRSSNYTNVGDNEVVPFLADLHSETDLPQAVKRSIQSWEAFRKAKELAKSQTPDNREYRKQEFQVFDIPHQVTSAMLRNVVCGKWYITEDKREMTLSNVLPVLHYPFDPRDLLSQCLIVLLSNPLNDKHECIVCRFRNEWISVQRELIMITAHLYLTTRSLIYRHCFIPKYHMVIDDCINYLKLCQLLCKRLIRLLLVLYPDSICLKCCVDDASLPCPPHLRIRCPVTYFAGISGTQSRDQFLIFSN